MVSQKSASKKYPAGSEYKSKDLMHRYKYAHTVKVRILNPVSQFGEELKGFDSGIFNASRQQHYYTDTQSSC